MICRRAWGNDEKSVLLRLSSLKLPLKLWAKPFSIGLLGIPRFIISQVLRFSGSQVLRLSGIPAMLEEVQLSLGFMTVMIITRKSEER